MTSKHPGFRVFVIGAGFSKLAGLPLACELFPLVKAAIERRHGRDTKFQRDLDAYIHYKRIADGIEIPELAVDLEAFLSYLDIEHFLELRGSDTWSQEGNESQLMIRAAIGEVISTHTPAADKLPAAYYRFAENLSIHDWILTFNYDVLLERAIEHVGKPYRLFPNRFTSIGKHLNTVNSKQEEVVLLKMHGSVDWFHDKQYLELRASLGPHKPNDSILHTVFDFPDRYKLTPLIDGPRSDDDPLQHFHRIRNVDRFYSENRTLEAPFILSPSHVKFVYAEPLLSFWNGMGKSGGMNLGISIIGFSLPPHDEYIRIGLYQMISNYQGYSWNTKWLSTTLKDHVKFVDFRDSEADVMKYQQRYSFAESSKSKFYFKGFGDDALNFLFTHQREI
ncbi:MAG: SIR2 family protein [Nitrosomonas sp.]|nr:SIR2 family protein [Nitrosomonas sp.]OQW81089.1 MAG: hypothetical protein BVN30_11855 [Proteobacteria bacterium ST_bin16]